MMASKTIQLLNASDFLAQYESKNTRKSYKVSLEHFFNAIYPDSKEKCYYSLDDLSLEYLGEERNHKLDLPHFKESLIGSAPLTIMRRLAVVRAFLEENGITFPKRFFKNLSGRFLEAFSEERVPRTRK